MADLVATRRAAIQAVIAHRGGAEACIKVAQVIQGLQSIVPAGLAAGTIEMPKSPEELGALLDRWIVAARQAAVKVGQQETQEALRFEGEARVLTAQIQESPGGEVIDFPRVPSSPPEAPKGRVRRRKKDAAPAE